MASVRGGEACPPPTLSSKVYAAACIVLSALFAWPAAFLSDGLRGSKVDAFIRRLRRLPAARNPLDDADGPEFILGAPQRRLWIFDRAKAGHRGFLPTVLGARLGALADRLIAAVMPPARTTRSAGDVTTDADTLLVTGSVTDRATGSPVRGAVVHVWQADPRVGPKEAAKYGDLDLDFDFRGHVLADTQGRYAVGTLVPVSIVMTSAVFAYLVNAVLWFVPGLVAAAAWKLLGKRLPYVDLLEVTRPPHLHVRVTAPGYDTLTTQLYFPDRLAPGEFESQLANDPAHPVKGGPSLPDALIVHPTRSHGGADGAAEAAVGGDSVTAAYPATKWVARFDFPLDAVGRWPARA